MFTIGPDKKFRVFGYDSHGDPSCYCFLPTDRKEPGWVIIDFSDHRAGQEFTLAEAKKVMRGLGAVRFSDEQEVKPVVVETNQFAGSLFG